MSDSDLQLGVQKRIISPLTFFPIAQNIFIQWSDENLFKQTQYKTHQWPSLHQGHPWIFIKEDLKTKAQGSPDAGFGPWHGQRSPPSRFPVGWDTCSEVRRPQGHGCSQSQRRTRVALGSRSPSVGFSPIPATWEPGRNE